MSVERFDNACLSPYQYIHPHLVGGFDAALGSSNARMPYVNVFRDRLQPAPAESEYECGRFLYAGPLWNHFGHIMVDSLHRLWAYDGHDAIVFNGVVNLGGTKTQAELLTWQPPSLVRRILDFLDITAPIRINRVPTTYQHIHVPRLGSIWRVGIELFYRELLERFQRKITEKVVDLRVASKLYYSRTHMFSEGGVLGSSYFEKALGANGFEICQPEQHSLDQQLANVIRTRTIVFDEGSSIHITELLNRVRPRVYMLPRRDMEHVFHIHIGERGYFERLADGSNVVCMMDRLGKYSPATIGVYRRPGEVFERMKRDGLVTGDFNEKEFHDAEMADLHQAPAEREVKAARLTELESIRSVKPA